MREAFRLRQLDGVVIVLQGIGQLAGQAGRFGLEQGFVLAEIVRAVGGKEMQAGQAVPQRFAVPCGVGMRAVRPRPRPNRGRDNGRRFG